MPTIPNNEPRRRYQSKKQAERKPTSDQEFYNSPAWRKARRAFLDSHPNNSLCAVCLKRGSIKHAAIVDHIIAVSQGGARLSEDNFMPMCDKCHNKKSGHEAHGFVPDFRRNSDGELVPTLAGIQQVYDKLIKFKIQ